MTTPEYLRGDSPLTEKELIARRLAAADREVADPRRRAILYVLESGGSAGYPLLQRATWLSLGGAKAQLDWLERAGYIEALRFFTPRDQAPRDGAARGVPRVSYRITGAGRSAYEVYMSLMAEAQEKLS